jgi:DnaJ like chaperone protein
MLRPMSIWTRIAAALSALAKGEGLAAVFEHLRAAPEKSVAFTIAVIALGAKLAKADGRVTRDEVSAFREVFTIAPEDEAEAAHVFNLARQDVAGFDAYARQVARMFGPGDRVLTDLVEGLVHVAVADGNLHPEEDGYLREVAAILGVADAALRCMVARAVPDGDPDPYAVLGVTPDAAPEAIRAAWRQAVRDNHPDQLIARGLPDEAVRLAEKRLVAVNRAWEELSRREPA